MENNHTYSDSFSKIPLLLDSLKSKDGNYKFMAPPITNINILKESSEIYHFMEVLCLCVQEKLCRELERFEPEAKFHIDCWEKPFGCGGGVTCVIQNGKVFEKAGVNISSISGMLSEDSAHQMRNRGLNINPKENSYRAVGISSVIHPLNPHVPTFHFNYRFFRVEFSNEEGLADSCSWFGGGCDLTPYYINENNIKHFHTTLKNVCDKHDKMFYPKYKEWCDNYFYIKHREERRGVGGIFFDDLYDSPAHSILPFIFDCAFTPLSAYVPIIQDRYLDEYTEKERHWQSIRRGRYVEFNLMYDRGTKFGLSVPGSRIESILMSLPLHATWEYCYTPEPGSKEEELLKYTKTPIEWAK